MTNYINKAVSESLDRLLTLSNDIEDLYRQKYNERSSYAKWSYTALDVIWKLGVFLTFAGLAASGYSFSATFLILIPTSLTLCFIAKIIQYPLLGRKDPNDFFKSLLDNSTKLIHRSKVDRLTGKDNIDLDIFTVTIRKRLWESLKFNLEDIKRRNWTIKNKTIDEINSNYENDCKVVTVYLDTLCLLNNLYHHKNKAANDILIKKLKSEATDNELLNNKVKTLISKYEDNYKNTSETILSQLNDTPKDTSLIAILDCIKV